MRDWREREASRAGHRGGREGKGAARAGGEGGVYRKGTRGGMGKWEGSATERARGRGREAPGAVARVREG